MNTTLINPEEHLYDVVNIRSNFNLVKTRLVVIQGFSALVNVDNIVQNLIDCGFNLSIEYDRTYTEVLPVLDSRSNEELSRVKEILSWS